MKEISIRGIIALFHVLWGQNSCQNSPIFRSLHSKSCPSFIRMWITR